MGGKGGEFVVEQTSDTRLLEKALRKRWNIPDHIRDSLPQQMASILESTESSPRNKIAAARVLISADHENMEQEKVDAMADLEKRIAELEAEANANLGGTEEQDEGTGEEEEEPKEEQGSDEVPVQAR